MHDALKERLLRKIEALPEEQLYQALDFVEFLESKYGSPDLGREASGLQRFAERLEDGLRRRTVSPGTIREAFQLISAADRVLSGVSSAGRQILDELGVEPEGGEAEGRRSAPESGSDGPRPDAPGVGDGGLGGGSGTSSAGEDRRP